MNIRFINLNKENLSFDYLQDNTLNKVIELRVGYQYLSDKFFKNNIPTESETEYAINYIEDELMKNKDLINNKEHLVFTHEKFINILRKNGFDKNIHSRNEIEALFSKYASVVMGEPLLRSNIGITREDYAIVLLLREIMHHLKFEEISLVNNL